LKWPTTQLKRVALLIPGGTPSVDEPRFWSEDDEGTSWVTIADMTRSTPVESTVRRLTAEGLVSKRLQVGAAGTVLFAMYASVGAVNVLGSPAAWNQAIMGIEPRPGLSDTRFLAYWLQSLRPRLSELFRSNTQDNLNAEQVGSLPFPSGPLHEQRAIANFLDAETARIDALIAKLLSMRRLTKERWHTKLRAIADDPRWAAVPLRRLWNVIDCKHLTPSYVSEGYPVISPGDVQPGRLDVQVAHRFVNEVDYARLTEGFRRPRPGDIVYSRNASIGIAAYVDTDEPFTMGQDVCLIRSESEDQLWLMYMLNSVGVDQLAEIKVGSTFDRINIGQLRELVIPVPPRDHQGIEARRIDIEAQKMRRVQETLNDEIRLLSERREAVITAAVTGEFDIPGAAA
jgi:type I restriction enzyme, S subunit